MRDVFAWQSEKFPVVDELVFIQTGVGLT